MNSFLQLTKFFFIALFSIITNPSIFIPSRRGKVLNKILKNLGPAFIKFGQLLSTRPDIIGEQLASDLKDLQDNVPPFSSKYVDRAFLKNYKKYPRDIFQEFNYKSVGSASIAQVHKAKKDNLYYAVKILRPNIHEKIEENIHLLKIITNFFHNHFDGKYHRFRLPEVVEFLHKNLLHEIDLTYEGANATQLRINLLHDKEVYVPQINWDLTQQEILVMEWIDGIPISKIHETNLDKKTILKNLVDTFCNQAYRDGVFHADMHPGNLFVDQYCRIIPIDFGIVGRMDKQTKFYITEILRGFLRHDYKLIAQIHFEAGYVDSHQNIDEFENACRAIGEQIVGKNLENLSIGNLFTSLLKLTNDFNMHTRIELLLIQKATILIEGVAKMVDRNMNIWQLSDQWLKAHYMKKTQIFKRAIRRNMEGLCDKFINFMNYYDKKRGITHKNYIPDRILKKSDNNHSRISAIDYILIGIIVIILMF